MHFMMKIVGYISDVLAVDAVSPVLDQPSCTARLPVYSELLAQDTDDAPCGSPKWGMGPITEVIVGTLIPERTSSDPGHIVWKRCIP